MKPRRCGRGQGFPSDTPVRIEGGADIARRALYLVGVPFRLHGRKADTGLDCIGVVAMALAGRCDAICIPCDYTLRGDYRGRISAILGSACFHTITDGASQPGDILLLCPACRQLHFAIATQKGLVHAHAGLRRVVLTPATLPWPIIGHWRYIGD